MTHVIQLILAECSSLVSWANQFQTFRRDTPAVEFLPRPIDVFHMQLLTLDEGDIPFNG
jgi:hypothetical protein